MIMTATAKQTQQFGVRATRLGMSINHQAAQPSRKFGATAQTNPFTEILTVTVKPILQLGRQTTIGQ